MPRTIETQVYKFDELSPEAQQVAVEKHSRALSDSWEFTDYDDIESIAKILGIDFDTIAHKSFDGRHICHKPKIYYTGFWSEGDGACFEGSYSYAINSRKAIREYAPQDTELHRIADLLAKTQRRNFYRISASARQYGDYYHSGCMVIDVADCTASDESDVIDALRAFADWIYSQIEEDHEYSTCEESARESIIANDYEFTADGKLA